MLTFEVIGQGATTTIYRDGATAIRRFANGTMFLFVSHSTLIFLYQKANINFDIKNQEYIKPLGSKLIFPI